MSASDAAAQSAISPPTSTTAPERGGRTDRQYTVTQTITTVRVCSYTHAEVRALLEAHRGRGEDLGEALHAAILDAGDITDRVVAGILILSTFEAAYIAEIIRGSLLSIDETQRDAARAVGLTHAQTVRLVILPQMVARTLPALTGQFASIIKDSSLLSIIAVIEITQTMREISASNFKLFECYFLLGVLYLALTLPVAAIGRHFEKRFDYAH